MKYAILILLTWLINGSIKFAVNFLSNKDAAFKLIGNGGFPSTHTAIIASMLSYCGFTLGWNHPIIAALLVLFWLISNDARSLRKIVGEHSKELNQMLKQKKHRERVGHNLIEILGGAIIGFIIGWLFSYYF